MIYYLTVYNMLNNKATHLTAKQQSSP